MRTEQEERPIKAGRRDLSNLLDSQLERYRGALRRLEGWNVPIPPTSRLRLYESRLAEALSRPGPGMLVTDEAAWSLAFDLREIDEIVEIVEAMGGVPDAEATRRLMLLPQGQEGPDEERNATARDAQYELLLWSGLTTAGVRARLADPDVAITFEGVVYYLEAKRPKTRARLDDRLRKAASQLKGRGPSIVAVALDLLVRPSGQLLHVQRPEDFSPAVAVYALDVLRSELHHIVNRVAGSSIAALVFTTRVPGFVLETRLATLGTAVHTERLASPGTPAFALASAVHDALASVL